MEARRIDRYQILEEIGSGGMAVVYKGIDTTLHREVAVKVMHPHLASREESRRRFSREARAVARLRHPAIVEIFDFSDDETRQSFIVTEFVPGRTLRVFADEVGFGLPELAAMAAERLADALQHAHENGIVHRDLKPENVMVRSDGQLKLMDFGIARILEGERMTMTGALVGSPLHMAPEIIEGKDAGESADIFALGTILYWMATGEMAFAGNNTTQTLRRILEGQFRDPRQIAPSCSDELAELIGRCLSREPALRPQTMADLGSELRAILAAAGIERSGEELEAFFLDPDARRRALRERFIERLIAEGEEALAEKRSARALSIFDRVLALDEDNERVHLHLERMKRSRVIRRRVRMGAAVGSGILLLGGVAMGLSAGVPGVVWGPERIPARDPGATAAPLGSGSPLAGGTVDGVAATGSSAEGSSPHGTSADGTTAGGSSAEGTTAGGTSADGTTAGGATAGGTSANGTTAGGATPGGTSADGATADGTSADGATAGGTMAGGTAAGSWPPGASPSSQTDPAQPPGSHSSAAPGQGAIGGEGALLASGTGAGAEGRGDPLPRPQPPGPSAASVSRMVHLRWVPQSAVLYIDGQRIETTAPAWSGTLSGGVHSLALSHPDCCQPWEEQLAIEGKGEPIRRSVALAPKESGWFEVDAEEPAAEVWYEGTFKGTVAEVNARGGVPVPFSREDTGRERYLKTVRFQLLPPQGRDDLRRSSGEVVVRAGQRTRSQRIHLEGQSP